MIDLVKWATGNEKRENFLKGMKNKNGGDLNVVDTSCDCYTFYDKNGLLYGYLHMRHDCWFVLDAYSNLLANVCGIERIDNQNVDGDKMVILTAGSRIHKLLPRNVVAEKQAIDKKIDSFKSLQQMDYNTWIDKTRAVKITAKKEGGVKHEVDMKGLCNLARQYLRYYDGEYQRFEINGYWCKIKNKREAVEDLMHDGFFDNDGEISAGNVQGVLHAVRNVVYQMDERE